ncbi:hypothetical protein A0J61_04831 [Choanephora cucurbitarum]|uniref:DUF202 domain-containing protein n=1 Tax=Choanephora cucurbitarum TaxID=101091 RepID=A0A1C7NEB3_9FUNG|nr:hypothetical protein A0J61_04831 [Choanephora cucurbitarum]
MSESSSILACSKTQSNYTAIVSNQILSNDKKNNQKIRLHQAPQNKINDLTMLCSFSEATVKNMDAATVCSLNFSLAKWSTSLYLENKASVARDHLANERTFLAWIRTSLSIISVGIGITQLFHLNKDQLNYSQLLPTWKQSIDSGKLIGLAFIAIGISYIFFAFIRYFHSQTAMTKGCFPASRGIVTITTLSTLFLLVTVFIVILFQKQG